MIISKKIIFQLASLLVSGMIHTGFLFPMESSYAPPKKEKTNVLVNLTLDKKIEARETIQVLQKMNVPLLFGNRHENVALTLDPETLALRKTYRYSLARGVKMGLAQKLGSKAKILKEKIKKKTEIRDGTFMVGITKALHRKIRAKFHELSKRSSEPVKSFEVRLTRSELQVNKF